MKKLFTILFTSLVIFPAMAAFEPLTTPFGQGGMSSEQGMIYTTSSGMMHSANRAAGSLGSGSVFSVSGTPVSAGALSSSAYNFSTSSVKRGNLSAVSIHNDVYQNLNTYETASQGPRRKIKEPDDQAPIGQEDPTSPVGDAMIPLLLLAAAYGLFRKRQLQN